MPIFSKPGIGGRPQFGLQTWLFNRAVQHCSDGQAEKNQQQQFSRFSSGNLFCYRIFQEQGEFGVKLTYIFPLGAPCAYILLSPWRRAKDYQLIKGCYNSNNKNACQVKPKRMHWPGGFASGSSVGRGDLGAHRSASHFLYPAEKAECLQ